MYYGVYLNLIGGEQHKWYYHYYTWILQSYFRLNPKSVFNQIQILTKGKNWYKKKITVKLSISKGKITSIIIRSYPSGLF